MCSSFLLAHYHSLGVPTAKCVGARRCNFGWFIVKICWLRSLDMARIENRAG
jgi:hypothetical protein